MTPSKMQKNFLLRPFRVSRFNIIWSLSLVIPSVIGASALNIMGSKIAGVINAAPLVIVLFGPCEDRQFGQGRPFFYVRQTFFGCAVMLAIICALI